MLPLFEIIEKGGGGGIIFPFGIGIPSDNNDQLIPCREFHAFDSDSAFPLQLALGVHQPCVSILHTPVQSGAVRELQFALFPGVIFFAPFF